MYERGRPFHPKQLVSPSIVQVYPGAHHGFGAATRRAIEVNARAFAVSWPQTLAFITATAAESAL